MKTPEQRAREAAEAIERDLRDRRGFRQAWDHIEDDRLEEEIREKWRGLLADVIRQAAEEEREASAAECDLWVRTYWAVERRDRAAGGEKLYGHYGAMVSKKCAESIRDRAKYSSTPCPPGGVCSRCKVACVGLLNTCCNCPCHLPESPR